MTMAETAVESSSSTVSAQREKVQINNINNNHPLVLNHNHRPMAKQRKRKRLSQVLDKLAGVGPNNNINNNNNEVVKGDEERMVFKFEVGGYRGAAAAAAAASEDEDVFSPASSSNRSPHSSTESPRISFSPLRPKDEPGVNHQVVQMPGPMPPMCACYQCVTGVSIGHHPPPLHPYDRFFPASPISPLTPTSPSPSYSFERYLHTKYLPDIFRRRSHSDSDLPLWFETAKAERAAAAAARAPWPPHPLALSLSGSFESDASSPQESPLDLSMKTLKASLERLAPPSLQLLPPGFMPPRGPVSVPVVKGDVASPTTKESVATLYNLEVSPVVEEMPPGSDVAYVCPVCGQMFSLHDRLAKHMASRHKSRQNSGEQSAKAYLCQECKRSFARSDMLTRHMRLHTGVKPYMCRVCNQVFSRSDHLSTHQRTHTGEKPYKCPQCPYAACRRDMITRHMRTHARFEPDTVPPTTVKTEHHH